MKLNSSALFEVKSLGAELDPLASFVNGTDIANNHNNSSNSSGIFEVKPLGAELDPLASFVNGSDVSKNQLLKFHDVEPIRIDRDAIVRGCQCNSSSTIMCHIYMIGGVFYF